MAPILAVPLASKHWGQRFYLGGWRSLGCHGYLQGKAPLSRYRPFHL